MKLRDEEGYGRVSMKVPTVILMASAAIFVVLAIVLAVNSKDKKKTDHVVTNRTEVEQEEAQAEAPGKKKLTADDLNFWDMYQDVDEKTVLEQTMGDDFKRKDELEQREAQMNQAKLDAEAEALKEAEENADPSTDGKHTLVKHPDGSTEWLVINTSLGLNNFEDTSFQSKNGILGYYLNGRNISKTGADISQYTNSVDWTRLKTEADYVMIRAGARGYDSGKLIPDTKFIEYVVGAVNAGMPFGVYFSSQAVTEAEATEEATFVMTQLAYAQSAIENGMNAVINNTSQTSDARNGITPEQAKNLPGYIDPSKYGTTTTTKDENGNTTTLEVDDKGNTTTAVKDRDGNVIKKTTVNTDPYGNVTTVVTDADGNQTVETVNKYDYLPKNDNTTTQNQTSDPGTGNSQTGVNNNTVSNSTGTNTTANASSGRFRVTYPVAVEMHLIPNAKSRIETLTNVQRTKVLKAFCDAIGKGGYNSMVSANKEFLLCRLELADLENNEIWVTNDGNLPDYPYSMSMWKYNTKSTLLKSLTGEYGVNVGFVDYSIR